MWQKLKSRFEDVSSRSTSIILRQLVRTMITNSDDVLLYCAHFEIDIRHRQADEHAFKDERKSIENADRINRTRLYDEQYSRELRVIDRSNTKELNLRNYESFQIEQDDSQLLSKLDSLHESTSYSANKFAKEFSFENLVRILQSFIVCQERNH